MESSKLHTEDYTHNQETNSTRVGGSGGVGERRGGEEKRGEEEEKAREKSLTEQQLIQMEEAGGLNIGCHGRVTECEDDCISRNKNNLS